MKTKKNKIKRVCIVDSSYTLLLYLLLSKIDEIESTFYFWSKGIPEQVKYYFRNQSYSFEKKPKNKLNRLWFAFKLYHLTRYTKWSFLKNKDLTYWGHDHLYFSSGILGNNKINVIEDGTSNYYPNNITNKEKRFRKLKEILFGHLYIPEQYKGISDPCSSIFLTGIKDTEIMNHPKTKVISIQKLWEKSSCDKKNLICKIFDFSFNDEECLKDKNEILLTQTFSEDKIISEKEKIQLYKMIVDNANLNKLIIKPHPRETTQYQKYFPHIYVFNKKIPIQLLSLCGIKFNRVYTICSTAAFDFPKGTEIIYIGSQIHPSIQNAYPNLIKQ